MAKGETYEEFVQKFEPKKTTDDCYTPPETYEEVKAWACERYGIDPEKIVRPFWPGADYKTADYPDGCVVLDNPPFSILSQIVTWYQERGILFFLFAPYLTCFNAIKNPGVCAVVCDAAVTYENGAVVSTVFVTNLEKEIVAMSAPDLTERINAVEKRRLAAEKKTRPKYKYPPEVLTATMLGYMSNHGIAYSVRHDRAHYIRALDSQRAVKKTIYGGGLLLSEKAAAEKAAAEKAAAENAVTEGAGTTSWTLSPKEKEIIKSLN